MPVSGCPSLVAFGLFWLFWILYVLFKNGLAGITLSLFTQATPAPGSAGGLSNAILGSLQMTAVGTLIGTPIGIMAGIYLAEFGQDNWVASLTRFINDILLSAPSIVIGLFIYEAYVVHVGHFSDGPARWHWRCWSSRSCCARRKTCCVSCRIRCVRRRMRLAHRSGKPCCS